LASSWPPAAGDSLAPAAGLPLDERLLVGLRRREGVRLAALLAGAGLGPPAVAAALAELRDELTPWRERGLLLEEGGRWRLSDPAGLALSNGVLAQLLDWWERRQAAAG
jgi:oxygen-independent coproporphyrinogen-3 oxidase